jgi:DNA-binding NarL/FixJ family response regulator
MDSIPAKILIIEDHPIMGNAVCSSIAAHIVSAEFDKVTTLAQALELLQIAKNAQQCYALIVTDLQLPDSQGVATLNALKSLSQSTPIVVLSMNDEPLVVQACKALAESYISKSDTSNEFELAIRTVSQQAGLDMPNKPDHQKTLGQAQANYEMDQLTPKQNEVMAELAQGYSNKEIAKRMNLSDETVRGHLVEIFKRLGVQNRTQATKYYLLKSHAQSKR